MSEYRSVVKKLPGVLNRQFTRHVIEFYKTSIEDSRYSVDQTLLNERLDTNAYVKNDAVRAQLIQESGDE